MFVGKGVDARRKGYMRQRLSGPSLFHELRKMVKNAHQEAVESFLNETKNGIQTEFEHLLLDIQNVVCEEGSVSESQRYPEIASQLQSQVEVLTQALKGYHGIISELRDETSS
jgi:hypothetical protein